MSAVREVIGVLRIAETLLDHTPVAVIMAIVSIVMDILAMVEKTLG